MEPKYGNVVLITEQDHSGIGQIFLPLVHCSFYIRQDTSFCLDHRPFLSKLPWSMLFLGKDFFLSISAREHVAIYVNGTDHHCNV